MSLYALNNFLHLLATVTWIGGMIYVNFVLFPSMAALTPPERGKLVPGISKRFSILAWASVVVLLITGLIKTPTQFLLNTSSHFGLWLTIKHILILLMIIFGLVITLKLVPKLRSIAPKAGEQPSKEFVNTQSMLSKLSITNMILGILVLFSVSMMKF